VNVDWLDRKCVDVEIFMCCATWESTFIRPRREGLRIKTLPPHVVDLLEDDQKRDYPMLRQGEYILRFPCSVRELIALKDGPDGVFIPDLDLEILQAEMEFGP
jgi:hypothetical protein